MKYAFVVVVSILGLCIVATSDLNSQSTIPHRVGAVNFSVSKLPAAIIARSITGAK